jgi:transposase InsO family protein
MRAKMTRQNYYAKRKIRKVAEVDSCLILELIKSERKYQPRLGGRKVLYLIKDKLKKNNVYIGRDRFFKFLGTHNLLIERKKSFFPRTTNSKHSLPVFSNLISDIKASSPNEIWVSDITYLRTEEGFMYASLTTDAGSRKIIGTNISDSLESKESIKALNKALKQLPKNKRPIHHSDRGSQYCCHEYVDTLLENNIDVSMTEVNHCYENAIAERVNGILKQEYSLDYTFKTKAQAKRAFYEAVRLYNYKRPHMSLGYKTPAEVHMQKVL